ncbi:MAG TPA: THUMP domain-containing protein, partial [Phycisphaerales bacterium]|nr:THUMP domain-containing protein [Phycisphaerales bacterium]
MNDGAMTPAGEAAGDEAARGAGMTGDLDLLVAARSGLESLVKRELSRLGYEGRGAQPGRVLFRGDLRAIARTNLWLRTADRVLVRLARLEGCRDFDALFDLAEGVDWARWVPRGASIHVRGRSLKSQLSSAPACQKTVKKALIEKLKAQWDTQTVEESEPVMVVEIEMLGDAATITLDTTGPSLHKRGYRNLVGEAPLKENLAAAMVMLSEWSPERPFIDPFCGSGTIPIEAAMLARNIAPGMARRFDAENWTAIEKSTWVAARGEAREAVLSGGGLSIAGYDIDDDVLTLARQHAERAGVAADVHFQRRPFEQLSSSRSGGTIVTNPPWGERLTDRVAIARTYESMAEVFNRLPGWSVSVLTPRTDFEEVVGRIAERRRKLHNGTIECTLYMFDGASSSIPDEPAAATFSGRAGKVEAPAAARPQSPRVELAERTLRQAELFSNRLATRLKHLRKWAAREEITCYRVYDRD